MGLPGQRRTSSSKRRRAAHFALAPTGLVACAKCKKMIRPHVVCKYCGTYRGRTVVVSKAVRRLKKATKRRQEGQAKS